jgi:hypothetical protein
MRKMTNKRRSEILDAMIDTILLSGPIKRTEMPKETGIAMRTIDEWIELILKIQEMPKLIADGDGRGMVLSLDIDSPEETHLENAIAFFNQASVRPIELEIDAEEEVKDEVLEEILDEILLEMEEPED